MTATLSDLSLTLTQTNEQRLLRVVKIGYSYVLGNTADPSTKDPATPFEVTIDILGDDVLTDDLLASSVDAHNLLCPPGEAVSVQREFTVAQGLLDEDIGDDEIKLTIRVHRDSEAPVEATTPIVKGKF